MAETCPLVDREKSLLTLGGTYVLAVISVVFFRWFAEPQPER